MFFPQFSHFYGTMQLAIRDALASEYSIILATPLLRKAEVMVTVDRKYASKACGRQDLEKVIDQVWEEVVVLGDSQLDLETKALSVQPIQIPLFECNL